jgi:hypothetical protein
MRRLIHWFDGVSLGPRLLIGALGTAIPFYFAALLSFLVSQSVKLSRPYTLGLHATVFIVLLTMVVFLYRYASVVRGEAQRQVEERRAALFHAYTFIDRVEIRRFEDLKAQPTAEAHFIEAFVVSRLSLQRIVEAAYYTFEAAFGKTIGWERIDFEVTFMSKSYSDGEITQEDKPKHL